jgi:DNA ligase (NAD+)
LKRLIASFDWKKLIEFLTDEVFVESIYWIWEKTVYSLKKYLTESQNQEILKQLYEVWVKFNIFEELEKLEVEKRGQRLPLHGIHFSITWKFILSRPKIVEILESFGAVWDEQPKKTTNFILVWENPGSKLQKAEKYGLQIVQWLDKLFERYPFLKSKFEEEILKEKAKEGKLF